MKRLLALILALSMLALCGCGSNAEETQPSTEPSEPTETIEATEPSETTEATEPSETTEATEPAVEYRNPLTGEILEAPVETRIVSLSIGNTKDAMPTRGLSQADMVFEMYVNGLTTRLLGMFTDPTEVYAIGSIRSQRYHFTDLSQSYDTIAGSAAGSGSVLHDVNQSGISYLNVDTNKATYYSFRDTDRHDGGYSWEHCLFAYGDGLYEYAENQGYSTKMDPEKDYGMIWAEDKALTDGQSASVVTLTFKLSSSSKDSIFTYDPETGNYNFSQYGMDMVDGNNSLPVAFRNVFVLLAETKTDENHYHVSDILGSGDGYFACDGYMIPIQWHRETDDDTFTFTLTDGTPLEQGVGSCYVAIAPTKSVVTSE